MATRVRLPPSVPACLAEPGAGGQGRALTAGRYRSVVDVYALLQRRDGMFLLLERSGTGYADGQLCPPSVHLASWLSELLLSDLLLAV